MALHDKTTTKASEKLQTQDQVVVLQMGTDSKCYKKTSCS